jgi:hypothetical protein
MLSSKLDIKWNTCDSTYMKYREETISETESEMKFPGVWGKEEERFCLMV